MSIHDGLVLLAIYVGTIAVGALYGWVSDRIKQRKRS